MSDLTMTPRFPGPGLAQALTIHFTPTRAQVRGDIRVSNLPKGVFAAVDIVQEGKIVVTLEGGSLRQGERIAIRIPFEGEALHGTRFDWKTSDGSTVESRTGGAKPAKPIIDSRVRSLDQFALRRRLVNALKEPQKSYHEFFCELDFESYPLLSAGWRIGDESNRSARARAVQDLESVLRSRVLARAVPLDKALSQPERDSKRSKASEGNVRCISEMFWLLVDSVPGFRKVRGNSPRARRVGFAFDAFANGDLRLKESSGSHGQPNGANIFCFAELAFLAIELGIDRDRWLQLLPALVRTQAIYLSAYGPVSGKGMPYDSYSRTPILPVTPATDSSIERLRGYYDRLSPEELRLESIRNARMAFLQDQQSEPASQKPRNSKVVQATAQR